MKISYCCDIGNVRENNEDGILVFDKFYRNAFGYFETEVSKFPVMLAVADGVGGEKYGEIASEYVLKALSKNVPKSSEEVVKALRECKVNFEGFVKRNFADINRSINSSTTLAGIVFLDVSKAVVFNVGDSRVYRYREGYVSRITKDHSYVEMLVDEGKINPDDVRIHPKRNIITSHISAENGEDFQVFVKEVKLFENDVFLICSDGFWEEILEEEMEEVLRKSVDWKDLSSEMVSIVKSRGGKDNISLIVLGIF